MGWHIWGPDGTSVCSGWAGLASPRGPSSCPRLTLTLPSAISNHNLSVSTSFRECSFAESQCTLQPCRAGCLAAPQAPQGCSAAPPWPCCVHPAQRPREELHWAGFPIHLVIHHLTRLVLCGVLFCCYRPRWLVVPVCSCCPTASLQKHLLDLHCGARGAPCAPQTSHHGQVMCRRFLPLSNNCC